MNARARTAAVAAAAMVAALLPVLAATTPAVAAQPVPGPHPARPAGAPDRHAQDLQAVRSGTSRRSATRSTSSARSPQVTKGNATTSVPGPDRVGHQHRQPAAELQAHHHRRRRRDRRGDARRHQADHRRHLQDRQRRDPLQARRAQPDHRRAADRPSHFTGNTNNPVTAARRDQHDASTSAAGSPSSTAPTTAGLAAVNATTGAVDPAFNLQRCPAASASTAPSPSSSSS